jgi:ribosomal protein L37AE/L43A
MHIRIQVIIESDNGTPELVQDVAHLEREELRPETLGLTLAEAKALLEGVQRTLVTQQTAAYLAQQALCPQCQTPRHRKGRVRSCIGRCLGRCASQMTGGSTAPVNRTPHGPSVP